MSKSDIIAGLVIGEISAWLVLVIFRNIQIDLLLLWSLPVVLPILTVSGLWVAGLLGKKIPILWQVAKFGLVGVLNTLIDLGVLNILSFVTGITKGFIVGGINIPGFSIAVINSYFWNKQWVFQGREGLSKDFPKFITVSVIGILINSAIVVGITTFIQPLFGSSEKVWLNIAKLIGIPVSMAWNFLGYKFIVFKRQ